MRYLIITYIKRPNGQMDENTQVATRVKKLDLQMASVILDFKTLSVVKCSLNGATVPRDWDRIVTYYYQHYKAVIERLFKENGYEIQNQEPQPQTDSN
jgi:hypothetical protein